MLLRSQLPLHSPRLFTAQLIPGLSSTAFGRLSHNFPRISSGIDSRFCGVRYTRTGQRNTKETPCLMFFGGILCNLTLTFLPPAQPLPHPNSPSQTPAKPRTSGRGLPGKECLPRHRDTLSLPLLSPVPSPVVFGIKTEVKNFPFHLFPHFRRCKSPVIWNSGVFAQSNVTPKELV